MLLSGGEIPQSVVPGSDLSPGSACSDESGTRRPGPRAHQLRERTRSKDTLTRWLPNVTSTCSGLGILLVTIWQSKAQIEAAYGTLADAVITNHGTKIIFSGVSDLSTMDYASRLVGEEEVPQHAVSTDTVRGGHSVNESTTRLRLVPSDILRQAPPGDALLVHGTLPPAHLHARPYFCSRRLRALAEGRGGDGQSAGIARRLRGLLRPVALRPPFRRPPRPMGGPRDVDASGCRPRATSRRRMSRPGASRLRSCTLALRTRVAVGKVRGKRRPFRRWRIRER